MAVKTECIIKSVKSDYKVIGPIVGVILAFVLFVYAIFVYKEIFTAYNVYIIVEIGTMIPVSYYVAFSPTTKEEMKGADNTLLLITINSIFMIMFAFVYQIMSCIPVPGVCRFPDVIILTIILLTIDALVVCPLAVAYARCKE